jgi:Putative zinc-finger
MCDFATLLIAWLDGELGIGDAADVERHLQVCLECRSRVEAYSQVSRAFEAYYDAFCQAAMAAPRPKLSRHTLMVSAVAATAAVASLLLFASPGRVQLSPARAPAPMATSNIVSQPDAPAAASAPASVQTVPALEQRHGAEQAGHRAPQPRFAENNGPPAATALEIAIPAEAILPPGAVPEGVSFTADVTIGPDGSAQQIRLRPQLTEFERRLPRP